MVVREAPPLEQVRRLGAQLLQSREHVNNVVALLRFAAHRDGEVAAEAVTVLQAFFAQLLRSDELLLHPAPYGAEGALPASAAAPAFHASHAPLLPLLHFPSCHVAASRAGGAGGRAREERAKEEVYQQWARARYGEYTGALKARLRSAEGSAASKVRGGAGGRGESCWWGRAWGADRRVEGRGRRGRIAGGMLGESEGEGEWGVGRGRCRQEQGGWRMAEGGEEEGRGDGWATVVRGTNACAMHFTGCEHPHYPSSSPLRAPPPLPHQRIAVEHLMELARLEKKGGLAGATINKILIPLVEGEAGDPSVLAKLASFFTHADVRRHVYGAVEQLCASMAAAATKHTSAAEDADGHAVSLLLIVITSPPTHQSQDAMCLNILEVLLAMPMPPAPKPGGKRLVAEVGQGGGEQDDLLSTWALPAPPSGACCLGLGGVPTAPSSPALAFLAWAAQQRGGKQSAGGKRGRQAGQQGSRKRAAGMKDEGGREEEGDQGEGEVEERRAAVVREERKALAGAWLGLLALPLPLEAYKKVGTTTPPRHTPHPFCPNISTPPPPPPPPLHAIYN
ncbi:unnamed protein product [Closterium sp. Naga37s-1]|nr:unnamed protein product [Closterium sp. Naga37s-1]